MRQKNFPIEEVHALCIRRHGCRKIFVRCSANVLRPNTEGGKNKPSRYDGFQITQNNFQEWLRVWRMAVSERNPNNKDLLKFARENKEKITDLVGQETQRLNSVKVSFGLQVKFSIERNDESQFMEHYFKEDEPHVTRNLL